MYRDFNNGICSSGLKILVLQYYLEIKLHKMFSEHRNNFAKHQAGVKIAIL